MMSLANETFEERFVHQHIFSSIIFTTIRNETILFRILNTVSRYMEEGIVKYISNYLIKHMTVFAFCILSF